MKREVGGSFHLTKTPGYIPKYVMNKVIDQFSTTKFLSPEVIRIPDTDYYLVGFMLSGIDKCPGYDTLIEEFKDHCRRHLILGSFGLSKEVEFNGVLVDFMVTHGDV